LFYQTGFAERGTWPQELYLDMREPLASGSGTSGSRYDKPADDKAKLRAGIVRRILG
jgi:hypothetical protein